MQSNYIKEAEKQFNKIPEKSINEKIITQKNADQLFQKECRSREISTSPPTGTFHNKKSCRWIQNFTSLASAEGSSYRDEKVSQRKELGN